MSDIGCVSGSAGGCLCTGSRCDDCDTCKVLGAAGARIAALEEELADWRESARNAAGERCGDEKHCTCVALLRKLLVWSEAQGAAMRGALEQIDYEYREPGLAIRCCPWCYREWPIHDDACVRKLALSGAAGQEVLAAIREGVVALDPLVNGNDALKAVRDRLCAVVGQRKKS